MAVYNPKSLRAEEFINDEIRPILEANKDLLGEAAEINV